MRVEEFAEHVKGVTALVRSGSQVSDERGIALIGADGVWSTVAAQHATQPRPRFAHRTAWRALIPADAVPDDSARRWCISGSGSTRIWCTIRSKAAASSTSSASCTTNSASPAGRPPATATKSFAISRAGHGMKKRAR